MSLLWAVTGAASADVFGRLQFSVKNADDEKPIAGARITCVDSANVHPPVTLTTDAQGSATSPDLQARAWNITTEADTFQTDTRTVTVVADTTTPVEILMEPLKEKVITIKGRRLLVNKSQPQSQTAIPNLPSYVQKFPVTAGNPQSLSNVIKSVPGMAADSVNQVHPRGEHSATAININGFYLPDALQGKASQQLIPEIVQNLDVMTGAYAPEYGGETAAILNLSLRAGPITPVRRFLLEGGSYSTVDGGLTAGGQLGAPYGLPNDQGQRARRFGYFINLNGRRTDNALEPPQPDDQTAHNIGSSESYFGNFNYHAGSKDEFTITLNDVPGFTQIANRTGLKDPKYAPVGQGFGFGGALSAADAASMGIVSQEAAVQDINQRDKNAFGLLQWRHDINSKLSSLITLGSSYSGQDIRNNNPAVSLQALPADNSIEYNPTLVRNYHHFQPQGSLTYTQGKHTYKAGLLYDDQTGHESYQLIPASQVALDALYANDPALAPAATPQTDAMGKPILDSQGNQVYKINPGATTPVLPVTRTGFYGAGYLQDTWRVTSKLTANYGERVDWYKQSQNLGQKGVNTIEGSPRINLAYAITPRTIGRLSYNHLFIQPPLAQGAIIGEAIQPEKLNQYEADVEHQIGARQRVKLAYFYKQMRDQIDTGLLIPLTQIGAYTSVNFQRGRVDGSELSYEYTPPNNIGFSAFANWTNQLDKPGGLQNTGAPVPLYNDHDQRNTINAGIAYTLPCGANAGLDIYYGSGVASSAVFGDHRNPRAEVNLSLSSGPRFLANHHIGVALNIENLFDRRDIINFQSGFSGSRFQQGRRILLSVFGQF